MKKILVILLILLAGNAWATDPGYSAITYGGSGTPVRTMYSSPTGTGGYLVNFKDAADKLQIREANGDSLQVSGKLGNGTSFDGVSYAEKRNASHLVSLLNDFTLIIGLKHTATTNGTDGEPYSESIGTGPSNLKTRLIVTYDATNTTYKFVYDVASGTDINTSFSVPNDTASWHMYVIRRSGTTVTTKLDNTTKTTTTASASTISGVSSVCFAINCSLVAGVNQDLWNGKLDEVKIYDAALDDATLTTIYNSGTWTSGTSSDTSLVSGWHFDEDNHGAVTNPAALETINDLDTADDKWILAAGADYVFPGISCGVKDTSKCFNFDNSGSSGHPIVLEGEGIGPGNWPVVTGCTTVSASDMVFKDIEFDGSCDNTDNLSFTAGGDRGRIINSYFHDAAQDSIHTGTTPSTCQNLADDNAVSMFKTQGGALAYGNVLVRDRYPFYWHNDSFSNAADYEVKNIMGNTKDKWECSDSGNCVVAGHTCNMSEQQTPQNYSSGGGVYNINGYKNTHYDTDETDGVRDNGIWGAGTLNPNRGHSMIGDMFFKIPSFQFGETSPFQIDMEDNYFGWSGVSFTRWWGDGETCNTYNAPTTMKNNTFYQDTSYRTQFFDITTQIVTPVTCATRNTGSPNFRATDVVSGNTYLGTGTFNIYCGGTNHTSQTFTNYKNFGIACNNANFETGSTTGSAPTSPKVFVLANDYDSNQFQVIIYNWAATANVDVDLSSVLNTCDSFDLYDTSDMEAGIAYSGSFNGTTVAVPVGTGVKFVAFWGKKTS